MTFENLIKGLPPGRGEVGKGAEPNSSEFILQLSTQAGSLTASLLGPAGQVLVSRPVTLNVAALAQMVRPEAYGHVLTEAVLAGQISQALPQAGLTRVRLVIADEPESLDWPTLIGEGAVRRMQLTIDQINNAFARLGNEKAIARPEQGEPGETFIDLYVASLAVPSIAKSLLGEQEYKNHKARLKPGQNAFLILGTGRYSFRGSGYVRGGIFDRIQVIINLACLVSWAHCSALPSCSCPTCSST